MSTPPLQVPDEFNHLYRTWQISEGGFLAVKKDQRVGGEIPYSVTDFALPFRLVSTSEHKVNSLQYRQLFFQETESSVRVFRDFPNTAQYSVVSYAPQALAFFVARSLGCSVIVQYYTARLFVFLFWMFIALCVLWMLPAYHWLIVMLSLLPMNVYLVNSLSADTVTNCLSLLLLGLILRECTRNGPVLPKSLLLITAICALLAFAKVVYAPLGLLVLLIPGSRFAKPAHRIIFVTGTAVFSICCALYWSGIVMENYIPDYLYNPGFRYHATVGFQADFDQQKKLILDDVLYFPRVVFNTIFFPQQPYLKSYIGFFGAFQDLVMPSYVYWIAYFGLIIIVFGSSKVRLSRVQKFLMLIAACVSFLALLLSQHLTWDRVGSGIVELMQGRYLIPLMPVLLILFSGIWTSTFKIVLPSVLLVIFLHVQAGLTLYKRYIHIPFESSVFFYSDLEKHDVNGNFETSDKNFSLPGENNSDTVRSRSGKNSVIASKMHPYILQTKFNDISAGDLFDIELWKKGKGISLVLIGGSPSCAGFYVANNDVDYTDRDGWEHIHMQYRVPQGCGDTDVNFLVHQPGDSVVNIDDISFTVRRKRE